MYQTKYFNKTSTATQQCEFCAVTWLSTSGSRQSLPLAGEIIYTVGCLQCFDAAGWLQEGHPPLKHASTVTKVKFLGGSAAEMAEAVQNPAFQNQFVDQKIFLGFHFDAVSLVMEMSGLLLIKCIQLRVVMSMLISNETATEDCGNRWAEMPKKCNSGNINHSRNWSVGIFTSLLLTTVCKVFVVPPASSHYQHHKR